MELTYTKQGDYLLPDLKLPQNPNLGKYAMMRRSFLKENKLGLYTGMMLSGRLNIHLTEVEQQAQAMMDATAENLKARQEEEAFVAPDLEDTAEFSPVSEEAEEVEDDFEEELPRGKRLDFGELQFGRDYEIK